MQGFIQIGYCSLCGTRNNLMEFEEVIVNAIRERLNAAAPPQDCVRDVLLNSLVKIARNLYFGFHEIIKVEQGPINAFEAKNRRIA